MDKDIEILSEVIIDGLKISYRDKNTDKGVIDEIFFEDPYNIKNIPNKSVIIDVGAHIGTFALRCAKEKNCTVYSYEPYENSYKILINNIRINMLDNKIKAFNKAISNENRYRDFYAQLNHYAGSSFYLDNSIPHHTVNVECITLQQIFKDNNIKHCDILKLDCEGEEKYILKETSMDTLRKIDKIVLEYHLYVDGNEIAEYLRKMKFTVYPNELPQVERSTLYATRQKDK